jgi:Protein of unknown function (DUF3568)
MLSEAAILPPMKSSRFLQIHSLGRLLAILWLGITLAGLSGCLAAAVGAGAGAVAYARGDLEATLGNDYQLVVDTTRDVLKELEFAPVSENKDALNAIFVARTAMDKKVEITITNSGKKLTSIKIRVGFFGDEKLSMAIFDKIKAGL